ncbi:hypothetical protein G7074_25765 [Pedobacter sp. HDW13]|nr:hypothetical protein [Pedobacter sp. HDW13]QIL42366.1 hypothetical protein G7074_25765 [Pedobacter sp. HDW13]
MFIKRSNLFFLIKKSSLPATLLLLTASLFGCKEKLQAPDNNQTEPQVAVVSTVAGKYIPGDVLLTSTSGMVVSSNGNLFVTDYLRHCIRKISPEGSVSVFAGSASGTEG